MMMMMTIITTLSSWQRRMWKDDRDSKGQNICIHCINKRLSNPQKLIFALQQATCHQQQVGIWEIKSSSAVLHGIHFFWINGFLKGHSCPTEAMNPVGEKMPGQVYTLPFPSFLLHNNESLGEKESRPNREDLTDSRTPTMGWQFAACECHGYPGLEASHMICFSHQRERARPRPLICFSHDLDLWVLFSVFLHGHTKRFYTVVLPWIGLTLS